MMLEWLVESLQTSSTYIIKYCIYVIRLPNWRQMGTMLQESWPNKVQELKEPPQMF